MKSVLLKGFALLVLLGVTMFLCSSSSDINVQESVGVRMDGNWKDDRYRLLDIAPSEVEKKQLPKDTSFVKKAIIPADVKTEQEASNKVVHATIVLSGSDSRSIHRPEVCLPGQGWLILRRQVQKLEVAGQDLEVMELHIERTNTLKGGGKEVVRAFYSYWLVGNGRSTPHTWKRILHTNWDMFFHNTAHRWAYPSFMSFYVLKGTNEDQRNEISARKRIYDTIKVFAPQFQKNLKK